MIKKQRILSSMVNTKSQLSVVGAFQMLQDALTELTGRLGIDGPTMKKKYNAFWVFIKTRVKFFKDLDWNEEIKTTAIISSISLAKMCIDFKITDASGEVAVYSRTEMCALDGETQKIRKLSTVGVSEDMLSKTKKCEINFAKLSMENLPVADRVQVKYTNIDFCHHTNNLEYVRLIMNTYTVAEMEKRRFSEMQIDYISQSFENELLDICKSSLDGKDEFIIQKDSKPIVKCEILF